MSLKEKFQKTIVFDLMKSLGLVNPMSVPKVSKVVINSGLGDALVDKTLIDRMSEDISMLSGQKPKVTRARKDISNFNRLKKGDAIGLMVTLRGDRMWDFLDKFVSVTLPGIKDFRGLSRKSFDGVGNYSIGIKNHTVFLEVDQNRVDNPRGLQVIIHTTAKNDNHAYLLLKNLGFPFRD
ncbi:MAG: 50S ribosomal protein L5 [Candidatus Dojkabacteria bacterium]|nr:MAG: 50S ribosomal protein L5 [Candidatus Dojkabacteria bacterium]